MLQSSCLNGATGRQGAPGPAGAPARCSHKLLSARPLGQPTRPPEARNATTNTVQGTQATWPSGGEIATRVGVALQPFRTDAYLRDGRMPDGRARPPADSTSSEQTRTALFFRCARRSALTRPSPLDAASELSLTERPCSGPFEAALNSLDSAARAGLALRLDYHEKACRCQAFTAAAPLGPLPVQP